MRGSLRRRRLGAWAALATCALALGLGAATRAPLESDNDFLDSHPDALWRVVHDLCAIDRRLLGLPAPCAAIHLREGWAVVKDTARRTHILVVPTRRITGIESPLLLQPGVPNYWRDAWRARRVFFHLVGRPVPRGDFAMAVNSQYGRSQDQLHLHIDCIWPNDAAALREAAGDLGAVWRPIELPGPPLTFLARWLPGDDLDADVFQLFARQVPGARDDMGAWALAVVPETRADGPGFVLLARRSDLPHHQPGVAEVLLDHACQVLKTPPA